MAYVGKQKGNYRVNHKKDQLRISNTFEVEQDAKDYCDELNAMLKAIVKVRYAQKPINFKSLPLSAPQWESVTNAMAISCEILESKLKPASFSQTVAEAMEEFLEKGYLPKKKVKKKPGISLRGIIRFWIGYFGPEKNLSEVTQEDINAGLEEKAKHTTKRARGRDQEKAKPVSKKTLDNHLNGYKSFSHWCQLEKKIGVRPEFTIKTQSDNKPAPRPLGMTKGQLEQFDMETVENAVMRLLTAAKKWDLNSEGGRRKFNRMYAMCLFAVSTGRRKKEVLKLKWSHVNLKTGTYTSIVKGDQLQSFPLVGKILDVLRDLKKSEGKVVNINDARFVFSAPGSDVAFTSSDAFNQVLADADLDGHYFHDLRDTAATMILNASKDWSVVAEVLGHGSVGELQRRYAVFFPEVLAVALEKALPAFLK